MADGHTLHLLLSFALLSTYVDMSHTIFAINGRHLII